MNKHEPLLTSGDAAKLLGVVPPTILAAANVGRLPVFSRTARGQRLFRLADVLKFKRARELRIAKRTDKERSELVTP
jgi:DNA-binding transcriptional MerR regulator